MHIKEMKFLDSKRTIERFISWFILPGNIFEPMESYLQVLNGKMAKMERNSVHIIRFSVLLIKKTN